MPTLLRILGGVRTTGESHRVTTFELFFDLVFVFAITQVSGYMAAAHSAVGIGQGLLLLALLWWSWAGYSWLGNQSHADEGLVRLAMIIAAMAVFVVALTIPEAWHDLPGGLDGPLVLGVAYGVIRLVHLTAYTLAAAEDASLRRQLALSGVFFSMGPVLLIVGALLGGWWQTLLWTLGLGVEWAGVYLTARGGNWRLNSPSHWTERHALFVILAVGESIVAIGVGASARPVSTEIVVGAALGILLSVALWWLYFDVVASAAERALERLAGYSRVLLASQAFTFAHYPLIAGIVLSALGVEQAIAHAGDSERFGGFGAAALCGGLAVYLLAHAVFWWRIGQGWPLPRLLGAAVLVASLPLVAAVPAVASLGVAVAVVWAVIAVEAVVFADRRAELRATEPA